MSAVPRSGMTDRDHVAGRPLAMIPDDVMRERVAQARTYTVAVLHKTASFDAAEHAPLVWEHGRRNLALQHDGVLTLVLAGWSDEEFAGVGVFDAPSEQVRLIMDADPGVQARIFTYEVHEVAGFPGSGLPV